MINRIKAYDNGWGPADEVAPQPQAPAGFIILPLYSAPPAGPASAMSFQEQLYRWAYQQAQATAERAAYDRIMS